MGGCALSEGEVRGVAALVKRIRPDRVQLNTAIRPPAKEYVAAVPEARLTELARLFSPKAQVIAEYPRQGKRVGPCTSQQAIFALLRRRPCSVEDLTRGLGLNSSEVVKLLAALEAKGQVQHARYHARVFYRPAAMVSGRYADRGQDERIRKPYSLMET